jgi:hypothetical protein
MADDTKTLQSIMDTAIEQIAASGEILTAGLRQAMMDAFRRGRWEGFQQGFRQGYQAGATAMRESILRAAETPPALDGPTLDLKGDSVLAVDAVVRSTDRAPKGAVAQFIGRVLARGQTATVSELQKAAEAAGEPFAPTSITNEVYRNRGSRYVQDKQTGRWALIDAASNGVSTADTGAETSSRDVQHAAE